MTREPADARPRFADHDASHHFVRHPAMTCFVPARRLAQAELHCHHAKANRILENNRRWRPATIDIPQIAGVRMLRKLVILIVGLGIVGLAGFYLITMPHSVAANELPDHKPDIANGAYIFNAGGCESCHAAPATDKCSDPKAKDPEKLGGGRCLATPFGTFNVPNISPDPDYGIGKWTTAQFVNAMKYGIRADGAHLYPAFPYTSYQRIKTEDLIDLKAYLDTLPPVANAVPPHDLRFPFSMRRGLGLWQLLYVDGKPFQPDPKAGGEINRGAYLVSGPAHCGECHTPRNFFGGVKQSVAFSGGPAPEGSSYIPNITPDEETGIGKWSHDDIVQMLETGFKPNFDSVGGAMAAVQRNMAKLTPEDRKAIAAYLKTLPAIKAARPQKKAVPPTQ
jgi:mono/diheme cytochrome c family protein